MKTKYGKYSMLQSQIHLIIHIHKYGQRTHSNELWKMPLVNKPQHTAHSHFDKTNWIERKWHQNKNVVQMSDHNPMLKKSRKLLSCETIFPWFDGSFFFFFRSSLNIGRSRSNTSLGFITHHSTRSWFVWIFSPSWI